MKNTEPLRGASTLAILACLFLACQFIKSPRTDTPVPETEDRALSGGATPPTLSNPARPERGQRQATTLQTPDRIKLFPNPELAPAWTIRYGDEFWRRPPLQDDLLTGGAQTAAVQDAPFNVGDVIERVTHVLEVDPASGLPGVEGGNYVARFDGDALRFSPHRVFEPSETAQTTEPDPAKAPDDLELGDLPSPLVRSEADPSTELRFRTVSVQRGGTVLFSAEEGAQEWSAVGNTAQTLLSPEWGVTEHYEAGVEGVAVSWVFPQRLPGTGPIEVVATLEGLSYAGFTPAGHHFADRQGVARVRIGQAEAVDALGNRWELPTQVNTDDRSTWVVELPGEVQAEATYPLAIDPIIKAEFGMDKPVPAAASGSQGDPAITSGAGMFFVVWEDTRHGDLTGSDIYGTRVSNAGAILDPLGIAICTTYESQSNPSVAAYGSTFLVVWEDERLGGNDIFGARVSSRGAVLDTLGFAIAIDPAGNDKSDPAVAGAPPGFLVVWEDRRAEWITGRDVYGARVDTAGVVLDLNGLAVCAQLTDQSNPTVITNNNGFFVAWEDDRNGNDTDIYGARVSSNGQLPDPLGVALSTAPSDQTELGAAANGNRALVTWRDRRNFGAWSDDIYGARLSFTGNGFSVLDPAAVGLAISTNTASQRTPAAAAHGNGFLVVWRDRRNNLTTGDDIYGARVDRDGLVLETNGLIICTNLENQTVPAVASGSAGYLVVWADRRNVLNTGSDIFGARVSAAGLLLETNGLAVGLSGAAQSAPAVAFNGTNYLVAWQDERRFTTNSTDILATRVTASGAIADPAGLRICTIPGSQQNPTVGTSGGEFLVAWEDSRNVLASGIDLYATRVTGAGAILDSAGLALSTAANDQTSPSAAGNAGTFLVVWQDQRRGGGNPSDIYGTRVSQSGLISNPSGLPISAGTADETQPCAAANPNGFFVAWQDQRFGNDDDIFGARLTTAGTVTDPAGIEICSEGDVQSSPVVASIGTNYLVAWSDERSRDTDSDIYAARVAGSGAVLDPDGVPVCTSPGPQLNPALAAGPDDYLLVWEDRGQGEQLSSARLSPQGAVLDMWGVGLAGSGDRTAPALAYGGANKYLLVNEAFRNNSQRIAANLVSSEPPSKYTLVQFARPAPTVAENGRFAKITVRLKGGYSGVVTVDFATTDGTATVGADYMPQAGRVVFANRKTSAVVMIPIVDDRVRDPGETVTLTLQNPVGGVWLGLNHTARLTILDND